MDKANYSWIGGLGEGGGSIRISFGFTSMVLRLNFGFISISLRSHFVFIATSL
jgi:hypothetical protein